VLFDDSYPRDRGVRIACQQLPVATIADRTAGGWRMESSCCGGRM
jgi:hypothetical protein